MWEEMTIKLKGLSEGNVKTNACREKNVESSFLYICELVKVSIV